MVDYPSLYKVILLWLMSSQDLGCLFIITQSMKYCFWDTCIIVYQHYEVLFIIRDQRPCFAYDSVLHREEWHNNFNLAFIIFFPLRKSHRNQRCQLCQGFFIIIILIFSYLCLTIGILWIYPQSILVHKLWAGSKAPKSFSYHLCANDSVFTSDLDTHLGL